MQDKRYLDKLDEQVQRVKELFAFQFEKVSYNNDKINESVSIPALDSVTENTEVRKCVYEDIDDTFTKLNKIFDGE